MSGFSRNEVILVRVPFSDLSGSKIRPVVIVNAPHRSQDLITVGLTSRTSGLLDGEFVLADWAGSGLNVPSAVKRAVFTVQRMLPLKLIGKLDAPDAERLDNSLRQWLGL
jgi:mRNA interferase MazF